MSPASAPLSRTRNKPKEEHLQEALVLIDSTLVLTTVRESFPAAEVADIILDIRQALVRVVEVPEVTDTEEITDEVELALT